MTQVKNLNSLETRFAEALQTTHISVDQKVYAVALSGGGDSMALLHILSHVLGPKNVVALHFNHNLREESASEALWVKEQCDLLGVHCYVGAWQDPATKGNIQQQARQARYTFLAQACKEQGGEAFCVAHTADDVLETFLMRLGRGSGIKGLAAMKRIGEMHGVQLLRPLLSFTRQELRDYLVLHAVSYLDDPSNENEKYLRVRLRQQKELFENAGLGSEALLASAHSLRRAEEALEMEANRLWGKYAAHDSKGVTLSASFLAEPEEMQLRLLEKALLETQPAPMAPRTSKRLLMLARMAEQDLPATLGGCIVHCTDSGFLFLPEKGAEKVKKTCGADSRTV